MTFGQSLLLLKPDCGNAPVSLAFIPIVGNAVVAIRDGAHSSSVLPDTLALALPILVPWFEQTDTRLPRAASQAIEVSLSVLWNEKHFF
jgi:hypothetical protein